MYEVKGITDGVPDSSISVSVQSVLSKIKYIKCVPVFDCFSYFIFGNNLACVAIERMVLAGEKTKRNKKKNSAHNR